MKGWGEGEGGDDTVGGGGWRVKLDLVMLGAARTGRARMRVSIALIISTTSSVPAAARLSHSAIKGCGAAAKY